MPKPAEEEEKGLETEETKDKDTEEETPSEEATPPEEDTPAEEAYSDVEKLALDMGWIPPDDFDESEGKGFVDAETFIKRGAEIQDNMRQSLKDQKKQLRSMGETMDQLKNHNERVYKAEVSRLKNEVEELQGERRKAIEDGDVGKVESLDKKIDQASEGIKAAPAASEQRSSAATESEFQGWHKENPWYGTNKSMTEYADAQADLDVFQGLPYEEKLQRVTARVKEMFPENFEGDKKKAPAKTSAQSRTAVEPPTRRRQAASRKTAADLNDTQRGIMRNFVRSGAMTEQEYIDDLVKIGEL